MSIYRKPGKPHMITVDLLVKCDMHIWQCFPPPKQSLSQFMSDKKFEKYDNSKLKFYCDILSQVATGLQYIHKKSLVHIDLCQDTVLVSSSYAKDNIFHVIFYCFLPKSKR